MLQPMQELKRRVDRLEKELKAIKSLLPNHLDEPWWKRTAGMFEGDKAFAEIVRLGRKIREAERKRKR